MLTRSPLVLYIVFKFLLRSKIISVSEIDFQTEFAKIAEEKRLEATNQERVSDGTFRKIYYALRHKKMAR
jgi:hypothetical protein